MNVLILSPGQDLAGTGIRIKQAFDKEYGWKVRNVHATDTYLKYPSDLRWPRDREEIEQCYEEADVIHNMDRMALYQLLDNGRGKPAILHHHGSRLRMDPRRTYAEGKGHTQLVSTVDLLEDAPGATWLPAPFDLDWIAERYGGIPRRGVKIGHAPTVREAKGTDKILAAIAQVKKSRSAVEQRLIENVQWKVCLSSKATCAIFIDQLTLGYGCNGIEAMALGIPLISGWEEPADRKRFVEATGEQPPFIEATRETLVTQIMRLVDAPDLRAQKGQIGRAFVERWHSEAKAVSILKPLYERVAGKVPA